MCICYNANVPLKTEKMTTWDFSSSLNKELLSKDLVKLLRFAVL